MKSKVIRIIFYICSISIIAFLSLAIHVDGVAMPEVTVIAIDHTGKPIDGVKVFYLYSYEYLEKNKYINADIERIEYLKERGKFSVTNSLGISKGTLYFRTVVNWLGIHMSGKSHLVLRHSEFEFEDIVIDSKIMKDKILKKAFTVEIIGKRK